FASIAFAPLPWPTLVPYTTLFRSDSSTDICREGCLARDNSHQLLTLVGGRDGKRLPVLCDGATGDIDALFLECPGNLAVAQGLARILARHQFLDQGADGGGGELAAFGGADMAGKEVLELENALGGMHVLLGCHPGDRGFVHADCLGDV